MPQGQSCSTCHHGALMAARVTLTPDPAAGDTQVSPLLPRHYVANISYAGKSRAAHANVAFPCANTHISLLPGMRRVPRVPPTRPGQPEGWQDPGAGPGAGLGTL